MTRRGFLLGSGAAGILAGKDWDAKYVDRLLTDSPWAKRQDVRLVHAGARTEIYLTTRWSSALPIRRALAIQQYGPDGLDSEQARELLAADSSHHLVEVFGFPATMFPDGTQRLEEDFARSGALIVAGQNRVEASEVIVPEHGMHISASFRFPRLKEIGPEAAEIVFRADSGPIRIVQKFPLRDMHYQGRLEL